MIAQLFSVMEMKIMRIDDITNEKYKQQTSGGQIGMSVRSVKIDQKADLIWAIADKLTGVYKPHEYGDVILPLTVIRRFDCILHDKKMKF